MKTAYRRVSLVRCDDFEIIMCAWTVGHVSPAHTHGWSTCKVVVPEGRFLNVTSGNGRVERRVYSAGNTFSVPVGASHEVTCLSPTGTSLHLYSPPLDAVAPHRPSAVHPKRGDASSPEVFGRIVAQVEAGTGPLVALQQRDEGRARSILRTVFRAPRATSRELKSLASALGASGS